MTTQTAAALVATVTRQSSSRWQSRLVAIIVRRTSRRPGRRQLKNKRLPAMLTATSDVAVEQYSTSCRGRTARSAPPRANCNYTRYSLLYEASAYSVDTMITGQFANWTSRGQTQVRRFCRF